MPSTNGFPAVLRCSAWKSGLVKVQDFGDYRASDKSLALTRLRNIQKSVAKEHSLWARE